MIKYRRDGSNDVYQFLSGVPVTPQTRFLQLSQPDVMDDFQRVTHYMRFALAVYGWPVYVMMHPGTWCCRLLPLFRYFIKTKAWCGIYRLIGETPFFVALDHVYKKVVVAIRGTLSLQDVLTDLKAEPETLPLTPPKDDWQGHKGMVQAAVYIKKKLINDGILQMAWDRDEAYCASSDLLKSERETAKYDLVLVGHSLGAGTAAILAILLKPDHPNLHCYAYSPPGGLLTLPCVEETKSYITSVVVGKDCVPRIGLPQLEMLRADILNHIKKTTDAKWKIISRGLMCCNRYSDDIPPGEMLERDVTAHPSNSAIGLSAHLPLFPPGRMIHVVRSHPRNQRTTGIFANAEPIYQAIWANNGDFDEVLVSPTMVNDHMPDNVLDALEKVVIRVAPDKPGHTLTEEQRLEMLNNPSCSSLPSPEASDTNNSHSHEEHYQRNQAGNSFRNPECSEGAEGGEALEEMEEQLNYGTSASPYHARQEEDVVIAPLASPETLSVASGLSAIGAFSPSSSLMGRDLLRHSLQKCAQKQLDSPSEADIETGEECKSRLLDLARGPSSGSSRSKKSSLNKTSINLDPEAGDDILDRGDDYTVKLRSGNTICVKAEVVNEMVRQGDRAESVSSLSQGIPDSVYSGGQSASEESSAVLEPSSHIHVTAHPPTKCLNSNKSLTRPDDTQTNFPHSNPPNSDHRPASPPQDINLSAIDRQGGGDENDKNPSQVGDYVRHSPLDQSNQHEYGHPNTYYTHAGVGYPNNAFHTPQRFLSFPSDEAKHLVEELCKEDISVEENDSAFVPIDDPVTSEVSEQKDDADGDSLPTDPLIPKLNARETVEDQFSTTSFSKPQIALRGKKIFKKAESDNCLLAGGKLSPRMRRSAEQDDIAHLCDALEVFESEEDKARLCQSVSMIVGEDDNENGDTDDNLISGRDGSDDAEMSPGVSETPNLKATTSALVPASGKRKTPNNQSVSFGGSVVIPTLQGGVESGFNGQPNHDTGSNLDTYTQNSSTEIPSTAYAEETTLEGQNLQLSSVPSETESEESPSVSGDIHTKPTVQQLTSASVADILNDRDSFSTMLQETHL
ncbi:Sn1-specific diacylglycerol lipase alpha [Plakobranchus ocellatus]|uniref:sn-1-specific diacylglycerol lipase n=1 Tax=Plakobranchus ocellatus TaxID=259542 RepID=A0AAV3ZGL3_9GAST|nr:Sn1-specific diacylglycerol lipase alpha [Plakobranchus ocellatus]